MEYNCLVAGEFMNGAHALVRFLLSSFPSAAPRDEHHQQAEGTPPPFAPSQLDGRSVRPRQALEMSHPSLPQLDICVVFHIHGTPLSAAATVEAPDVVLFVFSLVDADSLRRTGAEWASRLAEIAPAASVIFVGMKSTGDGAAAAVEPGVIAAAARAMRARAYFEVREDSGAVIVELRLFIARACTGELRDAGDLTEADIHKSRQDGALFVLSRPAAEVEGGSLRCVSPSGTWDTGVLQGRRCSVWRYKRHPRSNRIFYINRLTKKSQYRRPPDYDGEEPEMTPAEREDAELMCLHAKMEEQQQRLKVKQSLVRRLEIEVERLRTQAMSLARQREMNTSGVQLSELREEVRAKEETFLQESFRLNARVQREMALTRRALKEEEEEREREGDVDNDECGDVFSGAQSWRRRIMDERDTLRGEIQSIIDGTRVSAAALRKVVERNVTQRERNASVHAELENIMKRSETITRRIFFVEGEEQRVRAEMSSAHAELETEKQALGPLLATRDKQQREWREQRQCAEALRIQQMMMTNEAHQLRMELTKVKGALWSLHGACKLEDTHEFARLHRSRNIRACAEMHATCAAHILTISFQHKELSTLLRRFDQVQRRRQNLLSNIYERCVQERLSLLREWYGLAADTSGPDDDAIAAHRLLLEERMDQLDTRIEQLRTCDATREEGRNIQQMGLRRAHNVLEKSFTYTVELPPSAQYNAVEVCWHILGERLRRVLAAVHSVLISEGFSNTNKSDEGAVNDRRECAGRIEHKALFHCEIWRCAVRSLMTHFSPKELRETLRGLLHRHPSLLDDNNGNGRGVSNTPEERVMLIVRGMLDTCFSTSHATGEKKSPEHVGRFPLPLPPPPTATPWMEQLLLSVLVSMGDERGLSENEAFVMTEERKLARCSSFNDALRRRLQQVYA